jgi:hypothetical protein
VACSSSRARRLGVGLLVHPRDEGLELDCLDAPLSSTADLQRPQVAAPHQRVDLRRRGGQDLGHVGEGQEAWLPVGGCHAPHYASVWRRWCSMGVVCLWTTR